MKGRILVVDDEPGIVEVLKVRLEANDYEVITAHDGEDALHKTRSEKPNLIILDVGLPVMSGLEVCVRLKRDEELCCIPILMLTAKSKHVGRNITDQCGADAFLPKPYSSEKLLNEISKFFAI